MATQQNVVQAYVDGRGELRIGNNGTTFYVGGAFFGGEVPAGTGIPVAGNVSFSSVAVNGTDVTVFGDTITLSGGKLYRISTSGQVSKDAAGATNSMVLLADGDEVFRNSNQPGVDADAVNNISNSAVIIATYDTDLQYRCEGAEATVANMRIFIQTIANI